MKMINVKINRQARQITVSELDEHCPEKIELIHGYLFWSEEERLKLLALLLANVGLDKAVRLGDLETWKAAIDDLTAVDS